MSYQYLSSAASTNVKTSACKLNRVIISSGGVTGTIDIYDHASTNTNPVLSLATADVKSNEIEMNMSMQNGLRVVLAGGTSPKITVVFDEQD